MKLPKQFIVPIFLFLQSYKPPFLKILHIA